MQQELYEALEVSAQLRGDADENPVDSQFRATADQITHISDNLLKLAQNSELLYQTAKSLQGNNDRLQESINERDKILNDTKSFAMHFKVSSSLRFR